MDAINAGLLRALQRFRNDIDAGNIQPDVLPPQGIFLHIWKNAVNNELKAERRRSRSPFYRDTRPRRDPDGRVLRDEYGRAQYPLRPRRAECGDDIVAADGDQLQAAIHREEAYGRAQREAEVRALLQDLSEGDLRALANCRDTDRFARIADALGVTSTLLRRMLARYRRRCA